MGSFMPTYDLLASILPGFAIATAEIANYP